MRAGLRPTVVFDLDGTLVDSDSFDGELYIKAVREILGDVEIDDSWQKYRHVTDAGVLSQIMEEVGVPDADRVNRQVRELFESMVQEYLGRGGPCCAIPGAREALDGLRRSGCKVGIATGGWSHTARMKLARAAIPVEDLVLASSDDSVDRVQIMLTCLDRLGGHADEAIYVGDGIWDLEASRQAGWAFIGVGKKLQGRCETWIADFTDEAWRLPHSDRLERTRVR